MNWHNDGNESRADRIATWIGWGFIALTSAVLVAQVGRAML